MKFTDASNDDNRNKGKETMLDHIVSKNISASIFPLKVQQILK